MAALQQLNFEQAMTLVFVFLPRWRPAAFGWAVGPSSGWASDMAAADRFDVILLRDGYAIVEIHSGGFGREVIEREFGCEGAAWDRIEEIVQAEADEAAAIALAIAEHDAEELLEAA